MSLSKLWKQFGYKSQKQKAYEDLVEQRRQEENRELHRRELAEISRQVEEERNSLRALRAERDSEVRQATQAVPDNLSEYPSASSYTWYQQPYTPVYYTLPVLSPEPASSYSPSANYQYLSNGTAVSGAVLANVEVGDSIALQLDGTNDLTFNQLLRSYDDIYGFSISKRKKKGKKFLPDWL